MKLHPGVVWQVKPDYLLVRTSGGVKLRAPRKNGIVLGQKISYTCNGAKSRIVDIFNRNHIADLGDIPLIETEYEEENYEEWFFMFPALWSWTNN